MAEGVANDAAVHTLGSAVWLKDAVEGWVKGRVEKMDRDSALLTIKLDSGELRPDVPAADCPLQNLETQGVEVRVLERTLCDTSSDPVLPQELKLEQLDPVRLQRRGPSRLPLRVSCVCTRCHAQNVTKSHRCHQQIRTVLPAGGTLAL